MTDKTPFPQSKRLKKADGTIAFVWDGKLHNWEGPALCPGGNEKKGEYYLYGIRKTRGEWNEARKQREGLPYYKNQSMKSKLSDYRN
jgi:hypothetical protein|tara:strand:+ start:253 stop:513 length:261 start_codon:yes stop_codon:yes gene_type:complete